MAEAPVVKCTNEEEPQEESSCFMSLLCFEPDRVCHSLYDQTLLSDDRILRNLLIAEECCLPNATYFDFQPEIKPQMRCVLANWMLDVRTDLQKLAHKCLMNLLLLSMEKI